MKEELLPTTFPEISDEVYAGFWIRTAAQLLDFMITIPVVGLVFYLNGLSKSAYFYMILPNLIFHVLFYVYLVKQYGGTPGKLIMGIKIIRKDGDDVNWHDATMRYLVIFCISILGIIVMIWTLNLIDNDTYMRLGFFKRAGLMKQFNPTYNNIELWISGIWTLSVIIVLLSNKRKRTVHDFIAGTVVVKSISLEKIREIIQPVTTGATEA